jgi:hypothetical protein
MSRRKNASIFKRDREAESFIFVTGIHSTARRWTSFPPTRVITQGAGLSLVRLLRQAPVLADNRFVLSNKVSFEHRSPTADDVIEVGMVDIQDGDKWIPLGKSNAWNWQQGCMLQWIPGTESKVIWNDREKDKFVCHILDVKTMEKHTLPAPIYALSPNGKEAVSCDFPAWRIAALATATRASKTVF